MLKLCGTIMKGDELVKFLKESNNALSITNAFIKCLKHDDVIKGYNKYKIIFSSQELVSFSVDKDIHEQ